MPFKDISIFKSVGHFVQQSGTILAISVVNIAANIRGLSQKVVDFCYNTRLCIRNSMKFV